MAKKMTSGIKLSAPTREEYEADQAARKNFRENPKPRRFDKKLTSLANAAADRRHADYMAKKDAEEHARKQAQEAFTAAACRGLPTSRKIERQAKCAIKQRKTASNPAPA